MSRSLTSLGLTGTDLVDEVWARVKSIPPGRVASYGEVGRSLQAPMSGFLIGRMMGRCPDGVPWWRVVAKSGSFPVGKIDPRLEWTQAEHLANEGVEVINGVVNMAVHFYEFN